MSENPEEPVFNDDTIHRIVKAFPDITDGDVRQVLTLKTTTRLGYRKIGDKLDPPLGKDTVMRIWQMYEALSKQAEEPPIEDEELRRLQGQATEKEQQQRLQQEKEKLLKKNLLLSLQTEGDDYITCVFKEKMPKLNPELYQEVMDTCKRNGYDLKTLLSQELLYPLTATKLIHGYPAFEYKGWTIPQDSNFDDWYDSWHTDPELANPCGEECLLLQLEDRLEEYDFLTPSITNTEAETMRQADRKYRAEKLIAKSI